MYIKDVFKHMYPHRLHAQIALLGALLLAGVMGIYTWYTVRDQVMLGSMTLENQAQALAENIATASAALIVTRRYSEIEELLIRTAEFPNVLRVQVAEPNGRLLADIVSTDTGPPQPYFNTPPIIPPRNRAAGIEHQDEYLVVWQPIESVGLLGWVRVEYSLRFVLDVRNRILRDGVIIGVVSILISIVLFLLFLRRPMRAIVKATNFASKLDEFRGKQMEIDTGTYEVEQLGQALNHVSARLHEQERAITGTGKRLQAILRHAIDGILTTDEHGVIESVNPAAERMFQYFADELIGRNFNVLVPDLMLGTNGAQDGDPLPSASAGDLRIECEVTAYRKDKTSFPMIVGISEMMLENHRMFVSIVRDITERKRLDRMKSDFIASVSHELRTPLTSIHGSLNLMASGEVEGVADDAKNLIELAYKNSGRLVRLINDIVDFERIESGRMDFDLRVVDLVPLIEQAIAPLEEYARSRNVEFVFEKPANDGKVMADAEKLNKVVTNLLVNAVRLSPANDQVTIEVTRKNGMLRFSVTDHGPGIPDEFRKYIFQKFVQVDATDIRYKAGAGLGLSIAKAIVDRFGGVVDYYSVPNLKTTFFVDLPEVDES